MNAAKIIESSGKSVEYKGLAGLFDCLMEHTVKETSAKFEWTGPKISPAVWQDILAFFRWTQETERSEAQVRLFVHPQHGWMAWAFPQKGGTHMTTSEIQNEEAAKQRSERVPEGYVAFGTVHHHCTASAFQSGTDQQDEKNVDGLHITVGHLDKPEYDLDCRLYLKGNKFQPDMSAFWAIPDEELSRLDWIKGLGYEVNAIRDSIARKAMKVPPPKDHPFSEQWKLNYIVPPKVITTVGPPPQNGWSRDNGQKMSRRERRRQGAQQAWDYHTTYPHNNYQSLRKTEKEVLEALADLLPYRTGVDAMDLYDAIAELGDSNSTDLYQDIMEECFENNIKLEDLYIEMMKVKAQKEAEEVMREAAEEAKAEGKTGTPQTNELGDYIQD